MSWYLAVLRKYADFSGRARRMEYWMFVLFNIIISTVLVILVAALANVKVLGPLLGVLAVLYGFGILLPALAVLVRRLHDSGRSGWWFFITFVPFIGSIILFVLLVLDSEPGPNNYGPNPKGVEPPPAPVKQINPAAPVGAATAAAVAPAAVQPPARCTVTFDADGKVLSVDAPQGSWSSRSQGQFTYYNQSAGSLLQATEILKKLDAIPQFTYYGIDTPDGQLGRDKVGYYTVAPLKTKELVVDARVSPPQTVEAEDLTAFGENMNGVAALKLRGEYANLVMMMKCGRCGYESPVETQSGEFTRECYCCGALNSTGRRTIHVYLMGMGDVEI